MDPYEQALRSHIAAGKDLLVMDERLLRSDKWLHWITVFATVVCFGIAASFAYRMLIEPHWTLALGSIVVSLAGVVNHIVSKDSKRRQANTIKRMARVKAMVERAERTLTVVTRVN